MVFQDVINILNRAVNRDDIAPTYMDFINRAVREVAAGHSFDQMGETATLTLPIATNQIALPDDFKDLQSGRFPAYAIIGSSTVRVPVPIYRKEEVSRFQAWFMPDPYLIITSDQPGFQIGLLPGFLTTSAWNILLYYFAYPAAVTDPTVGTPLLTFYPQLIISKTLSLIFESINDPMWEEHDHQFQVLMAEFTNADVEITKPEKSN